MARDQLESRGHAPTIPDDANDPPRFSQVTETSKDAFVQELRRFFAESQAAERLSELPTVEKYALGFGTGLDPYETTIAIIQEFADVSEGLPHIAVLSTTGQSRRLSIGRPIIASVQKPPRVRAANTETYALADGDRLVYRTTPDSKNPVISTVVFPATHFPTADPVTAARAADIVRTFKHQALYARAHAINLAGGGTTVQFEAAGPLAQNTARNEIEFLPESSPNAITALGLGDFGTSAAGDTITGSAPSMTLTVVGAGFTAAMVGRYVTLGGSSTSANNGRFLIAAVPTSDSIVYTNTDGVAEAFVGGTWFIGYRDDSRNLLRPKMNRYHQCMDLSIQVEIITESPTTRRELTDLVLSAFNFWLEDRHFTLTGRGVFDDQLDGDFSDEVYQISVHSEVKAAGEADVPRPEDEKDRVYVSRVEVPITTFMYIDRPVLVTEGPAAGQNYVLDAENVGYDPGLPGAS